MNTSIDTLNQTLADHQERARKIDELSAAADVFAPALAHIKAERKKLMEAGPDAPVAPEDAMCLLMRHQETIQAALDLDEVVLLANETLADLLKVYEVVTAKCAEIADRAKQLHDALEAERNDAEALRDWCRELENSIAGTAERGWN